MAFWWVNHKQTRDNEVRGGYLWSPMRKANGAFNQTYENMRFVRPGDVVFSYAFGRIGAVGTVEVAAVACPKPTDFGTVGDYWSDEGWLVEVAFRPVVKPLVPKDHLPAIGPELPARHSPLKPDGNGNQSCYLAGISDVLGCLLLELLNMDIHGVRDDQATYDVHAEHDPRVVADIRRIELDTSVPDTERAQLVKARVGQGLFRKRVILLDQACHVTGVDDARVLVASHIKPWAEANNAERISGFNGILLSPHVDALFDAHLMTFEDDGRMHFHPSLPRDVLERWSIDPDRKTEPFRAEKRPFLAQHRACFANKVV